MRGLRPRRMELWRALMVKGYPLELRVLIKDEKKEKSSAYKIFARTPEQAEQRVQQLLERPGVLYYGALPRAERNSTDIVAGRVVWVDCDDPMAVARLTGLAATHPPNVIVESGSITDGVANVQALWFLDQLVPPNEIRLACRTLATYLGADMGSTDPARVLKCPGTLDVKPGAKTAAIVRLSKAPYRLARLTAGLPVPVDLTGRPVAPNGAPMGNGALTTLLTNVWSADRKERHGAHMKVAGHMIKCYGHLMPLWELQEYFVSWSLTHQDPPYPREELERCFRDTVRKEYQKRNGH